MNDFMDIPAENIIEEGQTTKPEHCNTKYIIYMDMSNEKQKIRVNTHYFPHYFRNGGKVSLCKFYDRGLCDTVEEYEKLDLAYIEAQAYGSWMDGAR